MTLEQELQKFKFDVLRKMPFYGDIIVNLQISEDYSVTTAKTNGVAIVYNPKYMSGVSPGERHYIIMHEVLHVLLMHCKRSPNKNDVLWNIACDMVVNKMLGELSASMCEMDIQIERPKNTVFETYEDSDTAENIYKRLCDSFKKGRSKKNCIRIDQPDGSYIKVLPTNDLIMEADPIHINMKSIDSLKASDDFSNAEDLIKTLVLKSIKKNKSNMGSILVPDYVYKLTESKRLPWQKLLKDFFTEEISDDASYTTPERKYIHMDLILPGHCLTDTAVEEIWAFVDSSSSIAKHEAEEFFTQLYRIAKEVKCKINICYWNTQVTDIYKNIKKESEILKCIPHHSGGTDINCIYKWMNENHVRPEIMLILTDGYFGNVNDERFLKKYRKKTILVLSSKIKITDKFNRIGKIAQLKENENDH